MGNPFRWEIGSCCGCGGTDICVTACTSPVPVAGAVVDLYTGSTLVATCTTGPGGCCTFTQAGTYTVTITVNGTQVYSGSQTLSGATITIPTSVIPVTVCAQTTASAPISGASVTIQSSGTTVGSCTTAASGCCTINLLATGSYTLIVSATGYVASTTTITATCDGTYTVTLCPTGGCVTFHVSGCGGVAVPGATVAVAGQTGTTDSTGNCCVPIATAGTYSYTVSMTRYQDGTGSVTVSGSCAAPPTINVSLLPASGYYCGCNSAATNTYLPFPATLHLTDSVYGAVTLTYSAFYGAWTGSLAVTFPGGCQCPTTQSVTLYYLWGDAGSGCGIYVFCNTVAIGGYFCPQTSSIGGAQVPQSGGSGYTQSGPTLNASTNFLGCTPCLGIAPGNCGGGASGDVIYQANNVTLTVTE